MTKPTSQTLTAERLRELLDYDPATGHFQWKRSLKGGVRAGDLAGCSSDSGGGREYKRIRVDGRLYYAHRLAWLYVCGEWPPNQIDHKNGQSDSISNLRAATSTENLGNTRKRSDNTSGFKGVSRHKSGWQVHVWRERKLVFRGLFGTAREGGIAYDEAATKFHGEFAKTNKALGLLP